MKYPNPTGRPFTNRLLMRIKSVFRPQRRNRGLSNPRLKRHHPNGGALVSTGMLEAMVAGRGAAGLVKSGNKVIANNDYEYAYAA